MDPKYGEISRAMRNRGVEIFMLGEVRWQWSENQRVHKVMLCLCMSRAAENMKTCCRRWIDLKNDRNVFPPFCSYANLETMEEILLHWKKVFKFSWSILVKQFDYYFQVSWYKIWNRFFLQVLFLLHLIFVMKTTCSFLFFTGWWSNVWWLWPSHDATWFRAGR